MKGKQTVILGKLKAHFIYLLLNHLTNCIPCWRVRKVIYRGFGMKIGHGSRINLGCIVLNPKGIKIGNNTMINEKVLLDGRGGLCIGDSCSISTEAIIYTRSHYADSAIFEGYSKCTRVGNCCWVGTRAVILPGSDLADRTIISASSLFKGVSVQNGIYQGCPAELIRMRKLEGNYNLEILAFFI